MAYTKTTWTDRVTEFPNRYTAIINGNQYTFARDNGVVTEVGTPVSANLMNKIENGLYDASVAIDIINNTSLPLKAPLNSPTFTGDPKVPTPIDTDNDTSIANTAFVKKYNVNVSINSSTSINLGLADAGNIFYLTGATAVTVTVPTNATVNYPIGTQIVLVRGTASDVTISPASGVTIVSSDSKRKINKQYESVTLLKYSSDAWALIGSLKT